ncbi:hypothetical protein B0H19DRAFT_1116677 [Mycena capillaripes]|nr:hypothetical protein B0H19DRAFT_1116677 [Mycena capillaripes]
MSLAPPIRQVQVDDTDSAVQYGFGWFSADPSLLTLGNFGPIYNGTSHASSSNSTLAFSFNGTSIHVQGTVDVSIDANNVTDPTWTCWIDDIPIPSSSFQFYENNWSLCSQDKIATGSHTLTLHVTSKGQPFYLDSLIYTPTPDAVFDSAVLIYPNDDPALNYSAGWKEDGEMLTQTENAQVNFTFHGTSVTMMGHLNPSYAINATSGSYSIDDGAWMSFPLPGLSSNKAAIQFNQVIFTTPTLPSGPHTLGVKYGGDVNHTPLFLKQLWVTNTTALATQTTAGPLAPTESSDGTSGRRSKAGATVGGIVAGVLMLILLAIIFLRHHLRKRRAKEETSSDPYPMAIANAPRPFASLPIVSSLQAGSKERSRKGTHATPSGPPLARPAVSVPVFIQSEDSGVRLPLATPVEIVEFPPGYTLT